ncbi:MAG: NAD(P)H-dependent oxidoreductase subunit E [Mariprofundales bacterium]|nr:NAD(P)H-dependent oxidoreductase subunit E [Mariprofundales bacterium]
MSDALTFSSEQLATIQALIKRYPTPRSALLPTLHLAQATFGHLSMEAQQLVADTLGIRLMAVREVVTFYTMFREQPCGTFRLEVCTNIGCCLNGANELVHHLCDYLGIKVGETTDDGLFTVTEVECAGACGGAPVVQINNLYHENVTCEQIETMVESMRQEATPEPSQHSEETTA